MLWDIPLSSSMHSLQDVASSPIDSPTLTTLLTELHMAN